MKTPPVKNKEYINIHIESLNAEGQGLGRINGYVIFVIGALPGEMCKIQIFKVSQKYAIARMVTFDTPSKLRTKPVCPHYGKCGGCQLQHMKYPAQLLYKQSKVIGALAKIAGIKKDVVSPTIGMDDPWHYRNKSIFTAANSIEDTVLGMYQPHSHRVIDIDKCYIADEKINTALKATKDWIRRSKILAYDERTSRGDLRALFARVAKNTGQVMVGAITRSDSLPDSDTFTTLLRRADNDIVSIFQNVNPNANSERMSYDTKFLWGTKSIHDTLNKLKFEISPYSFYQVNPHQTVKLYDKVLKLCNLNGNERILDAFCGVGTIGQYLAPHAGEVIGVESSSDAINDAKQNSKRNNIRNTKYLAGDCSNILPQLIDADIAFDIIIIDPPRKGCDERVIHELKKAKSPKIIYVSCNPATMSRDIRELTKAGYELKLAQPFDMFPQTDHVETVCLLELK